MVSRGISALISFHAVWKRDLILCYFQATPAEGRRTREGRIGRYEQLRLVKHHFAPLKVLQTFLSDSQHTDGVQHCHGKHYFLFFLIKAVSIQRITEDAAGLSAGLLDTRLLQGFTVIS